MGDAFAPPRSCRVLIVSRTRFYRDGLAEILSRDNYIDVVGTASNRSRAIAAARELQPEVILVDLEVQEALLTLAELGEAPRGVRVLTLAVPDAEDAVIAFAEAGVAGYVTHDTSLEELVQSVRAIARGETLCSSRIAAMLLRRVAALAAERPRLRSEARLTAREAEVAALLGEGLANKQIARNLGIELPTVKNHVHSILAKVGARSRTEAVSRLRPWAASVGAEVRRI